MFRLVAYAALLAAPFGLNIVPMHGQAADAMKTKPPVPVPDTRTGVLANGLSYIIQRETTSPGKTHLIYAVNVGWDDEQVGEAEFAHLTEHLLMSNARADGSSLQGRNLIESWGAKRGLDTNAYTQPVRTFVSLTVDSARADPLAQPLSTFRNWMDLDFTQGDVEREAAAVTEEMRRTPQAYAAGTEELKRQLEPADFARRSREMRLQSLKGANRDAVLRFYRRTYSASAVKLIIVGDIDPDKAEAAIRERFGDLPLRPTITRTADVPAKGVRFALARVAGTEAPLIAIEFRGTKDSQSWQAGQALPALKAAMAIVNQRFRDATRRYGSPISSLKLNRTTSEEDGSAVLTIGGAYRTGRLEDSLKLIFSVLSGIRHSGLSPSDIELASSAAKQVDSIPLDLRGQARRLLFGQAGRTIPSSTQAPSATEIEQALQGLLSDSAITISVRGVPAEQAVSEGLARKWIAAGLRGDGRPAAVATVAPAELQVAPVTVPGFIGFNTVNVGEGYATKITSTGQPPLHLLFLSAAAPERPSRLSVRFVSARGLDNSDDATRAVLPVLAGVVGNNGVGGLDRFQLEDWIGDRRISHQVSVFRNRSELEFEAGWSDLDALFGVVRSYFGLKELNPIAYGDYRSRNPGAKLDGRLLRAADIGAFSDVYRSLFSSPRDGILVVRGANSEEDRQLITNLVAKFLIDLPATRDPFEPGVVRQAKPGFTTEYWPETNRARVSISFASGYQAADRNESSLFNLTRDIVYGRLQRRLRDQERGIYGVSVNLAYNLFPGTAWATIEFDCAPENADRLARAALEELELLQAGGPFTDLEQRRIDATPAGGSGDPWLVERYFLARGERGKLQNPLIPVTTDGDNVRRVVGAYLAPSTARVVLRMPERLR